MPDEAPKRGRSLGSAAARAAVETAPVANAVVFNQPEGEALILEPDWNPTLTPAQAVNEGTHAPNPEPKVFEAPAAIEEPVEIEPEPETFVAMIHPDGPEADAAGFERNEDGALLIPASLYPELVAHGFKLAGAAE